MIEGFSLRNQPSKEVDYDFLKEGRKQSEVRLEKALARVKSMVQYPEARDQYIRLLIVVTTLQESKVVKETIRPCLVELSEDPDVDVRYFAGQALQACDQNWYCVSKTMAEKEALIYAEKHGLDIVSVCPSTWALCFNPL